jgi:hypothetical protein
MAYASNLSAMHRLLHTTLKLGDRVRLRKPHPCGAQEWEVVRLGTDVKLKCVGCGHLVVIPRSKLTGSLREILPPEGRSE